MLGKKWPQGASLEGVVEDKGVAEEEDVEADEDADVDGVQILE